MSNPAGPSRDHEERSVRPPATADAGIHIPREVAEAEGLPEELDANVVGPYRFPDPRRRRTAAWLYLFTGVAVALGGDGVGGHWVGAALLVTLAVWHFLAAWRLGVEQDRALEQAAAEVPFAVGHASAAVTFHGFRSRPRWSVIMYSADEPPSRRALVELDGVDGHRIGTPYIEAVPTG